jgi:hypothetical protein
VRAAAMLRVASERTAGNRAGGITNGSPTLISNDCDVVDERSRAVARRIGSL